MSNQYTRNSNDDIQFWCDKFELFFLLFQFFKVTSLLASTQVMQFDLPILSGKTIQIQVNLTGIYDRYLSRQNRSIVNLDKINLEFHVNYSNELTSTEGYYRRMNIELCLNYSSAITFQIKDIEDDNDK